MLIGRHVGSFCILFIKTSSLRNEWSVGGQVMVLFVFCTLMCEWSFVFAIDCILDDVCRCARYYNVFPFWK